MIQISARGVYLLLVPQGRALVRDRALISFSRNNPKFKTKLEDENVRLKKCPHMKTITEKLG